MDIERELAGIDFSPLSRVKESLRQKIMMRRAAAASFVGQELSDDSLDQVIAAGQAQPNVKPSNNRPKKK